MILARQNFLNMEPRFAVLPGGILFLLAVFYAMDFACRHPRCGGRRGELAMRGKFFTLDRCVHYRPFCGADIDTDLGADQEATSEHPPINRRADRTGA